MIMYTYVSTSIDDILHVALYVGFSSPRSRDSRRRYSRSGHSILSDRYNEDSASLYQGDAATRNGSRRESTRWSPIKPRQSEIYDEHEQHRGRDSETWRIRQSMDDDLGYVDEHGRAWSGSPDPLPVPIHGQPPPPPRNVHFAEKRDPTSTRLMSPQLASAAALLHPPSPNTSAHDLKLFREKAQSPSPPTLQSSAEPVFDMASAPDTGLYADGWKSWAAEAQKYPKSARSPLAAGSVRVRVDAVSGNKTGRSYQSRTMQAAAAGPSRGPSGRVGATTVGQGGWGDSHANASWGSALRQNGNHDMQREEEEYSEEYTDDGEHVHVHESTTMAYAKSPPLMPKHPSTLGPDTSHPHHIVDGGGIAISPARGALFGANRHPKDRLHWAFDPRKDPRVRATMSALEALAYEAAHLGVSTSVC
jgi:hypothetical protein